MLAAPGAKVCGNCRLFKAVTKEDGTWKGDCRVMLDRGMFPASAPVCNKFLPRAAPLPRALPKDQERERATRRPQIAPVVRKADVPLPEFENMTRDELKAVLREAMEETSDVRLAPKWEGGMILMKPGAEGLQPKELPIDALFHKVVMLRDRLRVLEAKLNGHAKLSDAEKVEFQQYITRCYGSLTTFNLLFADKDEGFTGEKGKGEV
ncbi:MAG TPA: hypothetical protein VGK67_36685 [Myxococcales bacterium]|jgi:hypothetical protein